MSSLPDSTGETLVTARIVVLQGDLQLDRLQELALLGLARVLEQRVDRLVERLSGNLTVKFRTTRTISPFSSHG